MKFKWWCIDNHALPDAFQRLQAVIAYVRLIEPSKDRHGSCRGHPELSPDTGCQVMSCRGHLNRINFTQYRGCNVIVWPRGPRDCVSIVVGYTMCTADAWRIAKIAKHGILPRIMAFRRQRTDGLRTALRTNSSAAFTGQSDTCAIHNSTSRQVHHLLIITLFLPCIEIIDHHMLIRKMDMTVVPNQRFLSMSCIL